MDMPGDDRQPPTSGTPIDASATPDDAADARLLAFIEGGLDAEAADAVAGLIARDPAVSRRADRLRTIIEALAEDAPAPGTAAVNRVLEAFAASRATNRLAALAEDATGAVRAVVAAASDWLASVDRVVADVLVDGRRPVAMPGFRGAGGGLSFNSEQGRLDLDVRPIADGAAASGTWRIRGQFRGVAQEDGSPWTVRRVAVLDAAGAMVVEAEADDRGGFVLDVPAPADAVVLDLGDGTGFVAPGLAIE